jgi:hypothetical protein
MTEHHLIEDLRSALDDETAGLHAPPAVAARARSKGRRRRTTRGLLAGIPAVGLAVGLTVASIGGAAPATPGSHAAQITHPHVVTAAFVLRQVAASYRSIGKYIVVSTSYDGPLTTTTSEDTTTGTTRSVISGGPARATYWITTNVSGDRDHWRTTYVDYTHHTWWVKQSRSSRLGKEGPSAFFVPSNEAAPAQIRRALAQGDLRVSRHGRVNGHAAISLVYAGPLAAKSSAMKFWVDAHSYQPVQLDSPPYNKNTTIDEAWVAKTPANVHQTNHPAIPAGFRRVAPSRSFN